MKLLCLISLILLSQLSNALCQLAPSNEHAFSPNPLQINQIPTLGFISTLEDNTVWLTQPTNEYQHGILGDRIEAKGFAWLSNEKEHQFTLKDNWVFEDLTPRMFTFNGQTLVMLIQSHSNQGASIAVYQLNNNEISLFAQSQAIGQSNRWLNIVGAADFDQDQELEIAAIITPHIGGQLTLFEITDQGLIAKGKPLSGVSNHKIGSMELGQHAILKGENQQPVMVLPSQNYQALNVVSWQNNKWQVQSTLPLGHSLTGNIQHKDGGIRIHTPKGESQFYELLCK